MADTTDNGELQTILVDPDELGKCTPAELRAYFGDLLSLEERGYLSRHEMPKLAWAAIDLDKYASIDDFITRCRKIHKAHAVRKAMKALTAGYYGKFFDFRSYTPDIVAINRSAPTRQGRPMTPHYTRTVENYGGYPKRIDPERVPDQAASWVRLFGAFRKTVGHRQGDVVCDEQLVAYISLRRHGNFAMYSTILGHADHLADGIMYKMHLDLVAAILAARDCSEAEIEPSLRCLRGIRYIVYTEFYNIRPGLQLWKRRTLFEPLYLKFNYLAECLPDWVCVAAEHDTENAAWQAQCAGLLTEIAQRCRDECRRHEAETAQAGLEAIAKRLAAQTYGEGDRPPERDDDQGNVVVIGPTARWSEVSPEGSLAFEAGAPAVTCPRTGATTGPSPVLRCDFPQQDNGEPVDIVIQVSGDGGNTNFRLKLGGLRRADLRKLGVVLPSGEAKAWAVHRRSPEGPWASARRVDFCIDPGAPNASDLV